MTTTLRTIPADQTAPQAAFDFAALAPLHQTHPDASIIELSNMMQDQRFNGYLIRDLERTLSLVTNPADWRAPIRCLVPTAWLSPVLAAVKFYTATDLHYVRQDGDLHEMTSPGYRAGPAGDH